MRRRLIALAALVLGGLLLTAGNARAHAELEASFPVAGSVVDELPRVVTLTFGEPVVLEGAAVDLLVDGTTIALVGVDLDESGKILTAIVPASAKATGSVTFRWSAVSEDGHPIAGDIGIGVGAGSVAPPTPVQPPTIAVGDERLVEGLVTADRLLGYLALSVLCGGLLFLMCLWPEGADVVRSRVLLWSAWGAALVASLGGIALQAATVRGSRIGQAVDPDAIATVLTSPFGRAWGARAALVLLAVPVLVALGRSGTALVRRPWFVVAAAAVSLGLLRTIGLVAHATEGDLGTIGAVADLVHLVGVASWMGGLVFLVAVVLPRRSVSELRRVVPAFSRLALFATIGIVAAGTVMAWDLAGSFDSLGDTEWGRLLVLKVGLFAILLTAAQLSKRWVYDRLGIAVALRGHVALVRPFVVSVAAEALLAAVVLGVASVLVTTSPGR